MDAFSLELVAYLLGRLADFRKKDRWGSFVPRLSHLSNAQDGDRVTVRTHARVIVITVTVVVDLDHLSFGFQALGLCILPHLLL